MANVKPTRQELIKVKVQIKTAQRGHGLLKDKRDSLIKIFLSTIKQALVLRKKVDENIVKAFEHYAFASAATSNKTLELISKNSTAEVLVALVTKNVMGVKVPSLDFEVNGDPVCYSMLETNADLDISLILLKEIMPDLIKLAELEYTAQKLAEEIEKTRRRVNALEYVIIPRMKKDMKYIQATLEEMARQQTVRLIKLKEQILT